MIQWFLAIHVMLKSGRLLLFPKHSIVIIQKYCILWGCYIYNLVFLGQGVSLSLSGMCSMVSTLKGKLDLLEVIILISLLIWIFKIIIWESERTSPCCHPLVYSLHACNRPWLDLCANRNWKHSPDLPHGGDSVGVRSWDLECKPRYFMQN